MYVACDKHGKKAISYVIEYLEQQHQSYENFFGPLETILPRVATGVKNGHRAIVSCGTGIGAEVGLNKFSGIRAVLASSPQIATWSVEKDNCNVLCLVGWEATEESINAILDAWFSAKYDGNEKRLKMIEVFDTWH